MLYVNVVKSACLASHLFALSLSLSSFPALIFDDCFEISMCWVPQVSQVVPFQPLTGLRREGLTVTTEQSDRGEGGVEQRGMIR